MSIELFVWATPNCWKITIARTKEQREFAQALFGQTAGSVAMASHRAAQPAGAGS